MNFEVTGPNTNIAYVQSNEVVLTNVQSALDLIATVNYDSGCSRIIVDKKNVAEDFFILSTRLAGDILQKFINYQAKLAIVGDYSVYDSKALKDFIYESNKGRDIFFVSTMEEAVSRLDRA